MASIKYKQNGEYKDIVVKVGDTSPIGLVADYDGSVVPDGWEQVKNILWENSSPSSAFVGSQVTLNDNISNYEYYEIYYNFKTDNIACMSTKAPVTQATYLTATVNFLVRRKIEAPSGTSITIGDGYFNGSYAQGATLDNTYLIPIKIIGYKKQIKKIAPVTPANGIIKNSYGTSQTDTYSQEYINGKLKCTKIWEGTAYQVNDTMVLDEPLEIGKMYIFKFLGNSSYYYNYDYFIYQNDPTSNTNAVQINYYSYPDTMGFRYRLSYQTSLKTLIINDASNGATNRAIKAIYKVN